MKFDHYYNYLTRRPQPHDSKSIVLALPAEVVTATEALLVQAVGLQSIHLLVGAGGHDGLPPPLAAQCVGAGAEQDAQAVLLGDSLQEAPQGPVALVLVAAVGARHAFGTGQHVLRAQRSITGRA